MKIPKLKGAGELRARILRQFNREKAANRNEEQLIGFDWSRYKSNKPKPETTPTQSEQLENGGVIKAQDGIVTQAINKVKSILPKEEPKEPINVVECCLKNMLLVLQLHSYLEVLILLSISY